MQADMTAMMKVKMGISAILQLTAKDEEITQAVTNLSLTSASIFYHIIFEVDPEYGSGLVPDSVKFCLKI